MHQSIRETTKNYVIENWILKTLYYIILWSFILTFLSVSTDGLNSIEK